MVQILVAPLCFCIQLEPVAVVAAADAVAGAGDVAACQLVQALL